MGTILFRQTRHGVERPTHDDRIRALGEMLVILLEVGGNAMIDQPNLAGETPRQLQAKKLDTWAKWELAALARRC